MVAKIHRYHLPKVGEGFVRKASGIPFEAMTIKPAGIEIGDSVRFGGRTFVLGRLGATITSTGLGLKNGATQSVSQAVLPVAVDSGATTMSITVGGTDGIAGDGVIAADEMVGGYVVVFKAAADKPFIRGIIANTAVGSGGGTCVITLDSPVPFALTVSDAAEAMHSPWYCLKQDNEIGNPVVGVATVVGTSGQYIWVQTWGPCFCSPQAAVGIAGATGLYWRHDGSLDVENADAYVSDQYAGFVLAENATHTQAAPFFMLQVMP